jgi:hypothetical protein
MIGGLFWSDKLHRATVDVSGQGCDRMGPENYFTLIKELDTQTEVTNVPRCDVAFDDFQRIASMDQIHEACDKRQMSPPRSYLPLRQKDPQGVRVTDTAQLGLRDSADVFIRIYDKKMESDGEIDAIRYEAELHDRAGLKAFKNLAAAVDLADMQRVLGEIIVTHLDFRKREEVSERNSNRADRVEWWEKVRMQMCAHSVGLTSLPIIGPKKLSKTVEHLHRQWGKTIAVMHYVCKEILGCSLGRVIEDWAEQNEEKVDWDRAKQRDLASLTFQNLLTPA